MDKPLSDNVLYRPDRSPRIAATPDTLKSFNPKSFHIPQAERARRECICIPHYAFLGEDRDLEDIAAAAEKVRANAGLIAQALDSLPIVSDEEGPYL